MRIKFLETKTPTRFKYEELTEGAVYQTEEAGRTSSYIIMRTKNLIVRLSTGQEIFPARARLMNYYKVNCELTLLEELPID